MYIILKTHIVNKCMLITLIKETQRYIGEMA